MTATGERPGSATTAGGALERAAGVELLGPVHGSGYRDGAALVRRADGQMVQLGPLMYALLEGIDGHRSPDELAAATSERLGRRLDAEQVRLLAGKLAAQGLLAGTESAAPPRANPLLALRWKVLVTDPAITRRLIAPFTFLFRPCVLWPVLVAFAVVCWFVLVEKGVASATAEAFHSPGLLLLVFALGVLSAGAHELGHAAACRYGGAEPGGMGMGLYLVWPAFYTDVTDAYRLDRRGRLRVDLAGLYLNAVVAVLTMAFWLVVRRDALLLLIALQLLQMVKQLSPVIRADGYHILADATGVPDLYAHIGPTMRRLVPGGRREPSALTGRARAIVTVWVLVVVPVLLSLMCGAVLLLPRLLTSAWQSGHRVAAALPQEFGSGDFLRGFAGLLQLLALFLPVLGSALVTQRVARMAVGKARAWSAGRPGRRVVAVLAGAAVVAGLAWAWWPSGQYQPVRASERGTLPSFVQLLGAPRTAVRSSSSPAPVLALAAIPQGGATAAHPALFLLPGHDGGQVTAVAVAGSGKTATGASFPFRLPSAPGPGDTQALAVNTQDGGVVYDISYALITIDHGAPVTNTNSAFAFASCRGCTTVAVSFQIVLVVGQSDTIAPINAAGALNVDCPSCLTTAIAYQIVVTVSQEPPAELQAKLRAALAKLDALPSLGAGATPAQVLAQVQSVQQQVQTALDQSGIETGTPASASSAESGSTPVATSSSASRSTAAAGTTAAEPSGSAAPTSSAAASTTSASPSGTASSSSRASSSSTAASSTSAATATPTP